MQKTSPVSSDDRLSRDKVLLTVAAIFAERATCSRAHVGAIIAKQGRIISTGYNGAPSGMPHCDHSKELPADAIGEVPEWQLGCQVAVHAEANAIAFAAREGRSTEGAELFTTVSPCINCAKLIINAGIRRVVAISPYRHRSAIMLLIDAGLEIEVYEDDQPPPEPS